MRSIHRLRHFIPKFPPKSSCTSFHPRLSSIPSKTLCTSAIILSSTDSTSSSKDNNDNKITINLSSKAVMHQNQNDPHIGHYERNFITKLRAMDEFLLKDQDLKGLRFTQRRSPNEFDPPLTVYWRKDVERKSMEVWGSLEALESEREKRSEMIEFANGEDVDTLVKKILRKGRKKDNARKFNRSSWPVRALSRENSNGSDSDQQSKESGKVVKWAIGINSFNCVAKGVAWWFTGSHALWSEMIHSAADTINQMVLAYGIQKSTKKPSSNHPYGYSNMQYVSSLISACGIFCVGCGLSVHHGISGLFHPHELESLYIGAGVLGLSFLSESVTLGIAINSIRESSKNENMTFFEYVYGGYDPSVNVVLLEDFAAVVGVAIAGGAMGLSYHFNSPIPDSVGCILIGGLLGGVAAFMMKTNSAALVGRSIPEDKKQMITEDLEGDIMIRQILDVKAIDMGNGIVRYKAEVDVDGRELTRYYLSQKNIDSIMQEIKAVESNEELEVFMLKHGEGIVEFLGEQVDRIEKDIKAQHPEVRHVDLEVL